MHDNGWIKVYRKLMRKGYYKRSQYIHLWVHILLCASHAETEFLWNGKMEKLMPGQFITGRNSLSSDTGIPPSTVEDILKLFETEQQIRQLKNNRFRLLTVLNWEDLQGLQQPIRQLADNKPTTSRHLADTFKNIKNEKNVRNKNSIPPTLDEVREYIKSKNYSVDSQKWYDHYESRGWMAGKTKMKDWQAGIRTWTHDNGFKKTNKHQQWADIGAHRLEPEPVGDETEINRLKIRIAEFDGKDLDAPMQKKLDGWKKELAVLKEG